MEKQLNAGQQAINVIVAGKAVMENKKKAMGRMIDGEGGRCCLRVMCEQFPGETEFSLKNNSMPMPWEFFDVFGFDSRYKEFDINAAEHTLSRHNDGAFTKEKTHKQIGEALVRYGQEKLFEYEKSLIS